MRHILTIAMCAAGLAAINARDAAADPAKKFVEAHFSAKKMAPLIEQRVEAKVRKTQDVDRIVKAVQAQLPEFYAASASAVAPLISADQMSRVSEFSASQTGKRLALADLNLAEEVRDQAEVCLEDGASRLRSVAADRARAIGLAARLVLGDCTVMREARSELTGTVSADQLQRARIYVDAGGVRAETIQALAAPAAQKAAKALIAAKVGKPGEEKVLAQAVLKAVATETAYWKQAASLHYAAAFRKDDLKKLAAFVTSDAGTEFLNAKPKIDAAIARTADAWFADSIQAALASNGTAAATAAMTVGMPATGPLPAPSVAIKPKGQPDLVMKPAN